MTTWTHPSALPASRSGKDGRPARLRAESQFAAALLVLAIGVVAALAPITVGGSATAVGAMMIAAGTGEALAGTFRVAKQPLGILPGVITLVAGGLLSAAGTLKFIPLVFLVIGWLGVRSAALILASVETSPKVRSWTFLAAATDVTLAIILVIGLSVASFPIWLFGATPEFLGSFSWLFAVSFLATAMLLLAAASDERT